MDFETTKATNPLKRPLSDVVDEPTPKRHAARVPNHLKSRVSTPFRSPLLSTTPNVPTTPSSVKASPKKGYVFAVPALPTHTKPTAIASRLANSTKRTTASPFKSPFTKSQYGSSSTPNRPIPTTAALKDKLETLRRAARLLKSDDNLRTLIQKWRSAGREAASDLWALVEGSGVTDGFTPTSGGGAQGKADKDGWDGMSLGGFDNNWGFEDSKKGSESGEEAFDKSWGWATVSEHVSRAEGSGLEAEEGEDEEKEEELPSAAKFKKELVDSLNKPYSPRTTLLPPTERGTYYGHAAVAAVAAEAAVGDHGLEDESAKEEEDAKAAAEQQTGMGRMLRELGIPKELFGWDDENEDWIDMDAKDA